MSRRAVKRTGAAALACGVATLQFAAFVMGDPLSLTSSPVTESFDSIGNTGNATLPSGWFVDSGSASSQFAFASNRTTHSGGTSGVGLLGQSSQGGTYNFANGNNSTATDRAVGWLGGNGFAIPRNLFAQFQNDTAATLTGLSIAYNVEQYRSGVRPLDMNLYVGTDGVAWTPVTAAKVTIPAGSTTGTAYNPALLIARPVMSIDSLSIQPGGVLYVRWEYINITSAIGTPAIGIDDVTFSAVSSTPPSTWAATGSGNWWENDNWAGAVPDTSGAAAAFTASIASPSAVNLGGTRTVGSLTFNSAHRYTLAGGTLNLAATTGQCFIYATTGDHLIQSAVTMQSNTSVSVAQGAALSTIGMISAPSQTLSKTGAGALNIVSADLDTLSIQQGTTRVTGVSRLKTLSIAGTASAPTAKLDLGIGGAIVLDYVTGASPASTTRSRIIAGRGAVIVATGNFTYTGQGITSTDAATANNAAGYGRYAIGMIDNADLIAFNGTGYTAFGNLPVDADSLIVRTTYAGDANLDGTIDSRDYSLINRAFNGTIPNVGWLSGDFNEDGSINADDFAVIDFGRLRQSGVLGFESPTAVPEPGMVGLLAVAASLQARRRRGIRATRDAVHL